MCLGDAGLEGTLFVRMLKSMPIKIWSIYFARFIFLLNFQNVKIFKSILKFLVLGVVVDEVVKRIRINILPIFKKWIIGIFARVNLFNICLWFKLVFEVLEGAFAAGGFSGTYLDICVTFFIFHCWISLVDVVFRLIHIFDRKVGIVHVLCLDAVLFPILNILLNLLNPVQLIFDIFDYLHVAFFYLRF